MKYKNIIRIILVTLLILMIPLIAMQFTDEVVWRLSDFVIAGILLFSTGLAYELVAQKGGTTAYRAATLIMVSAALLLIWINLAVGIIGSEDNPANLAYMGVLAIGVISIAIARLRPQAMARALFVIAAAQALVPVIALIMWNPQDVSWGAAGVSGVFALNMFFVLLFVGSALLFRKAGSAGTVLD